MLNAVVSSKNPKGLTENPIEVNGILSREEVYSRQ
jgi:hypothetical protein